MNIKIEESLIYQSKHLSSNPAPEFKESLFWEVSLAQLVGGGYTNQHLSSNPHGREFRFSFILEATHVIYLEDYALILTKIKNISTHTKWLCASLVGAEAGN
jgi:hypothetical protein